MSKKYRLLKGFPDVKKGSVYTKNRLTRNYDCKDGDFSLGINHNCLSSELVENNPDWFEEVKELVVEDGLFTLSDMKDAWSHGKTHGNHGATFDSWVDYWATVGGSEKFKKAIASKTPTTKQPEEKERGITICNKGEAAPSNEWEIVRFNIVTGEVLSVLRKSDGVVVSVGSFDKDEDVVETLRIVDDKIRIRFLNKSSMWLNDFKPSTIEEKKDRIEVKNIRCVGNSFITESFKKDFYKVYEFLCPEISNDKFPAIKEAIEKILNQH